MRWKDNGWVMVFSPPPLAHGAMRVNGRAGKVLVRKAGLPIVAIRPDAAGQKRTAMFRKLICLLGLATASAAFAQTAPQAAPAPAAPAPAVKTVDADPALWVVKDADTTIYLFGTIHVLKPGLSWFDEAVKAAFDRSDALVLEMVQPDPEAMKGLVMSKGFTQDGPSLTERLPEKDRPLYLRTLGEMGVPAAAFDRAQPWLVATNLSLLPLMKGGYVAEQGPEQVLSAAAKAEDKPVIGLETPEQQIGYLADMPEKLQISFLEATLKDLPGAEKEMTRMVDAWSKGQPDTLGKIMNKGMKDTPELGRILLTDRNARWATWIKQRLETPGTVFVAVGAGHLAGKGSVQDQLATLGIKATRIAY